VPSLDGNEQAQGRELEFFGVDGHLLKGDLTRPGGPSDAGEFVGEGDGGDVVTATALEFEGPAAEAIRARVALGMAEDGASAVSEEHAEVDVPALADMAEVAHRTGGVFTGSEAEVAGEVASGGEATGVADEGNESGSGEGTDPGDGPETRDIGELMAEGVEGAFGKMDAVVELLDVVADGGEDGMKNGGDLRFVGVDRLVNGGDNETGPEGDDDTELTQETADGVDACGAGGEPTGAETVEGGEGLLVDGLDGDRVDVFVAGGLEEGLGIGAVGLVALAIAGYVVRGE
jgi:hypothetical protein